MDKVLNASSLATNSGMTKYVYENTTEFLIDNMYINETDRLDVQDKIKQYLVNNQTFSLNTNLYQIVEEYIRTNDLKDSDRFELDIAIPLLDKIRAEKYPDATMTFTSEPKSIKPVQFNNESKSVKIRIENNVAIEDYSIERQNDNVVITLLNGLGDGILNE